MPWRRRTSRARPPCSSAWRLCGDIEHENVGKDMLGPVSRIASTKRGEFHPPPSEKRCDGLSPARAPSGGEGDRRKDRLATVLRVACWNWRPWWVVNLFPCRSGTVEQVSS